MSIASRDLVGRVALMAVFWALYGLLGWSMASSQAFTRADTYIHTFDADFYDFVKGVTDADSDRPRPETHPLFPLLFRPVGILIRNVLRSDVAAAVFLTSLAAALCVALAHLFLRLARLSPASALAWSAVLGLSFAHLVFGTIPDTFIFSAASIVMLFVLMTKYPGSLRHFVPVSVVASGILVTNLVQSAIVFFVSRWRDSSLMARLGALGWGLLVVLVSVRGLALIEQLVYPKAIATVPGLRGEARWIFVPSTWEQGFRRFKMLGRHVFVYSLVGPKIELVGPLMPRRHRSDMPRFSMPPIGRFHPIGVLANGLWIGLVAASAVGLVRARSYREPTVVALGLSLVFNLVLTYLYGVELFLYSPNWMFLLVGLVAVGSARGYPPGSWAARLCLAGAMALAVCEAVNNGLVVLDLVRTFQTFRLLNP